MAQYGPLRYRSAVRFELTPPATAAGMMVDMVTGQPAEGIVKLHVVAAAALRGRPGRTRRRVRAGADDGRSEVTVGG